MLEYGPKHLIEEEMKWNPSVRRKKAYSILNNLIITFSINKARVIFFKKDWAIFKQQY